MGWEYDPAVFAANLRAERNRVRLSQDELAERTGIARQTLTNYEGGDANPVLSNVAKIARELGCSVSTLVGAE